MEEKKFGKYQVLGQLGEGAMGVVFKAQDPVLNRFVAIKTISASLGSDSDLRQRFQREAQAAASLNHPNIITIHDFGEESGKIYMAMELLEGRDLKDLIVEGAFRTYDDKLAVMEQICDGLAYAHAKKIVHRDLKPGNIHIQPNGQVKVLDFGLARLGQSDMTKTGIVMGTPNYMSPEQVMGEKVDARSDVFSLGAVFYELLTAHKPFEADSVHAVLFQVVHKEPQPVRHWSPDVPTVLVQLVEKCLSKAAADRFADAGALREALRGVRQALTSGQLDNADLADMLEYELVSDGEVDPLPGDADGTQMLTETPVMRPGGPTSKSPGPRTGSFPARTGAGAPTPGPRSAPRPAAAPKPPQPAPASKAPMMALGAVAVVAVAIAGWMALRPASPTTPPGTTDAASQKMDALTAVLVQTQLDLAQRVLDDKDYRGAVSQAERALSLDPANARARELLNTAQTTLKELDGAAAEAKTAFDQGDTAKASAALGKVLAIDPKHPIAEELSGKLNKFFQSQADEARRAMGRSREQANASGLSTRSEFQEASGIASRAEGQFGKGEFAQATQSFLQARDGFDRARRAAEKEAAEKKAAEAKTAAEKAAATKAAATTAASPATSPSVMPPTTLPAATPVPLPGKTFTPGKTTLTGVAVGKGGPAGFDTAGVTKPAEFVGQVLFEPTPETVRAGESFTVKVLLVNEGKKSVDLKSVSANAYAGGRRIPLTAALLASEVEPGGRVVVAEIPATLGEGVASWLLDLTITSTKGENYRSQLTLK